MEKKLSEMKPTAWEESDDWRSIVAPDQQADFLKRVSEAQRDGYRVKSVLVMAGVPVIYNVEQVE